MNKEIEKMLSDLARKYQHLPEGKEKKETWQVIERAADIIEGKVKIEDISQT